MGVKTRYPKAFIQKDSIFPGLPHLGHTFSVWDGNHGLLATGDCEVDAWVNAYQHIVQREGQCP